MANEKVKKGEIAISKQFKIYENYLKSIDIFKKRCYLNIKEKI